MAGLAAYLDPSMTDRIFTLRDAWNGGGYDLAIELGPRNDARLSRALNAIWTHPDLAGCYEHTDREPNEQPRIEASVAATTLLGVARIGGRAGIACSTVVIRFDDGIDWIHFSLPMGALGGIFDVGAFPFADGGDLAWRPELDEWLCALGRRVFEAAPFRLALIGSEGGEIEDVDHFYAAGVPTERWLGYLVRNGNHLEWSAPNQKAPFTITGPAEKWPGLLRAGAI